MHLYTLGSEGPVREFSSTRYEDDTRSPPTARFKPKKLKNVENRRLLQDTGILSRIFETAATARLQVGVMLVHER